MRRLYWQFFAIVLLTTVGSVGVMIVVSKGLGARPFAREVQQRQDSFALDMAAGILQKEGLRAAQSLAASASRQQSPSTLEIEPVGLAEVCSPAERGADVRLVVAEGRCFRISVKQSDLQQSWLDIAGLFPWLSTSLASFVSAYWLALTVVKPVTQLRDSLSALASGRFQARINPNVRRMRNEFGDLAKDFDRTAERLQALQEGQQRLFRQISHELRSPMSRIQAALGVLRQNPARFAAMITRLEREVERLDKLVEQILTLARLTAREEVISLQKVDVIDLVADIREDARFEGHGRQVDVQYSGIASYVAEIDGEMIYQAIENIVRNAVAYAPADTTIRITGDVHEDTLTLRVSDDGPGIPADERDAIFEPFRRGSNARQGGYGLGLAIARHAIELHGGAINVTSRKEGGLTVSVSIRRSHVQIFGGKSHDETEISG